MIFDVCLYAGEVEMLELRRRTLADVARTVAVVCTLTHQGEEYCEVPLPEGMAAASSSSVYFFEPRSPMPRGHRGGARTPWYQHIERQHRAAMRDAVEAAGAGPDDVVMVSDVDEIPDPAIVPHLADFCDANTATGWACLQQRFHSTALDLLNPHQPWLGTCVSRLENLAPQAMRDARGDYSKMAHCAPGGWHLSWFGTDAERQRKLDTFSHAELRGCYDPAEGRRTLRHPNGEELIRLTSFAMHQELWPPPLYDGSFVPPDHWFHDPECNVFQGD